MPLCHVRIYFILRRDHSRTFNIPAVYLLKLQYAHCAQNCTETRMEETSHSQEHDDTDLSTTLLSPPRLQPYAQSSGPSETPSQQTQHPLCLI